MCNRIEIRKVQLISLNLIHNIGMNGKIIEVQVVQVKIHFILILKRIANNSPRQPSFVLCFLKI